MAWLHGKTLRMSELREPDDDPAKSGLEVQARVIAQGLNLAPALG